MMRIYRFKKYRQRDEILRQAKPCRSAKNSKEVLTPKVVLRSKILNEPFRKAEFAGGTRRFRKLRMTKEQWAVISSQWSEKTEY